MRSIVTLLCAAPLLAASLAAGEFAYTPEPPREPVPAEPAEVVPPSAPVVEEEPEEDDESLSGQVRVVEAEYRAALAKSAIMPDYLKAARARYEELDRLLAAAHEEKFAELTGNEELKALIRGNGASWLRIRNAVMNSVLGDGSGRRAFEALAIAGDMTRDRIRFISGLFAPPSAPRMANLHLDGARLLSENGERDLPFGVLRAEGAPLRVVPLDEETADWAGAVAGLHFFMESGEYLGGLPLEDAGECSGVYLSPGKSIVAVDRGKSVERDLLFYTFPGLEPRPEGVVRTTAASGPGLVWIDDTAVLVNTASDGDARGCRDRNCDILSVTLYDIESGTPMAFRQGTPLRDYYLGDSADGMLVVKSRGYPNVGGWRAYGPDQAETASEAVSLSRNTLPSVRRMTVINHSGADLDGIYISYGDFYVRAARETPRGGQATIAVPANSGAIGLYAETATRERVVLVFVLQSLPKSDRLRLGNDDGTPYLAPLDDRDAETTRIPGAAEIEEGADMEIIVDQGS